eukprot:999356-Pyramimonas_sp.AAC.1
MQLETINKAIDHICCAKAVLHDNISMSGPSGTERDFTMSQEDGNLDCNRRAMNPCSLHWRDPDDEKTRVPYGWQ